MGTSNWHDLSRSMLATVGSPGNTIDHPYRKISSTSHHTACDSSFVNLNFRPLTRKNLLIETNLIRCSPALPIPGTIHLSPGIGVYEVYHINWQRLLGGCPSPSTLAGVVYSWFMLVSASYNARRGLCLPQPYALQVGCAAK